MGAIFSTFSLQVQNFPVRFMIVLTIGALCWLEPYYLPKNSVGGLMAILAQGHFLLGYLYQYKNGKINRGYALRYIPAAVALFGACFFIPVEKLFETLAAAYFLVHFFYDERYLLRENADFSGWKITLPTIGLLTVEALYRFAEIRFFWLYSGILALSAGSMLWMLVREISLTRRLSARSAYFAVIFSIAAILTLPGKILQGSVNLNAINFIILIHIGNWYWRYLIRFSTDRPLMRRFLLETSVVNGIMGALMFFRFHPSFSVLLSGLAGVFFLHPYFHVWSLLHFVSTYRSTDILNWLPVKNGNLQPGYGSQVQH